MRSPVTGEYWTSKEEYDQTDIEGFYELKKQESENAVFCDTRFRVIVDGSEIEIRGVNFDGFLFNGRTFSPVRGTPPEGISIFSLDLGLTFITTNYISSSENDIIGCVVNVGGIIRVFPDLWGTKYNFFFFREVQPFGDFTIPLDGFVRLAFVRPGITTSHLVHGQRVVATIPSDAMVVRCDVNAECTATVPLLLRDIDSVNILLLK